MTITVDLTPALRASLREARNFYSPHHFTLQLYQAPSVPRLLGSGNRWNCRLLKTIVVGSRVIHLPIITWSEHCAPLGRSEYLTPYVLALRAVLGGVNIEFTRWGVITLTDALASKGGES